MSRQQRVEMITDPIAYVIEPGLDAAHGVVAVATLGIPNSLLWPLTPNDSVIHGTAQGITNWPFDEHPSDTKTTTKKETTKKKPVVDTKTTTQKETTKKKPVVVSSSSNDDNNDDKDDSDDSEPPQRNKGGHSADLVKIGREGFVVLDEYLSRSNVRGYPKQGRRITNVLKRTNMCP